MSKQAFYSMSELERMTGRSRRWLSGVVRGMKLKTFRGENNSKMIDDSGFKLLKQEIGPSHEVEIHKPRKSKAAQSASA